MGNMARMIERMAFACASALGSTFVSEEATPQKDHKVPAEAASAVSKPATSDAPADAFDKPATAGPAEQPKLSSSTKKDVLLYGLARLLLFVVLTAVIHGIVLAMGMANSFPLLMSALLALILALPLSMLLFRKLRLRVNGEIANWDADRRAHKEQMRRQLQERMG